MTVARKPGHRGERAISRKPLRGECRAFSGVTWLTRVRFYPIILHTRLSGASGARHSPRPLIGEGRDISTARAPSAPRDSEFASGRSYLVSAPDRRHTDPKRFRKGKRQHALDPPPPDARGPFTPQRRADA